MRSAEASTEGAVPSRSLAGGSEREAGGGARLCHGGGVGYGLQAAAAAYSPPHARALLLFVIINALKSCRGQVSGSNSLSGTLVQYIELLSWFAM